jgi:hypothetical protein
METILPPAVVLRVCMPALCHMRRLLCPRLRTLVAKGATDRASLVPSEPAAPRVGDELCARATSLARKEELHERLVVATPSIIACRVNRPDSRANNSVALHSCRPRHSGKRNVPTRPTCAMDGNIGDHASRRDAATTSRTATIAAVG